MTNRSKYPISLKYFMWEWQVIFRVNCQHSADRVFNELDRALNPNIYLVGFLQNENSIFPPVCVEPEFIEDKIVYFQNIDEVANKINSSGIKMRYSGHNQQEIMDAIKAKESFKNGIEVILNDSYITKIHFATIGIKINDFIVHIILELDRNAYQSHIYLSNKHENEFPPINRFLSLIETTIQAYLHDKFLLLSLNNPGNPHSLTARNDEEILCEAAKIFMSSLAIAGDNLEGCNEFFKHCNKLSTHLYENKVNNGHILIASKDHDNIEIALKLESPIRISDYSKARKLLQQSNEIFGAICDSTYIYGLGKIKSTYNRIDESIYNIYFTGIFCWNINHLDTNLMKIRYGKPHFFRESINKEKFHSDAKRIFSSISDNECNELYSLSSIATKQKKGTMLIISEKAKEESNRLKNQSIAISPIKLTEELILQLTSIDGGLLIDTKGIAYANGVIIDGIVGSSGDSSRGSRYNSALTYQEFRKKDIATMIVVVSEDGMVDVIPLLKPQINRSEIDYYLYSLNQLNNEIRFDRKTFYEIMHWFEDHEFYLNLTDCNQINVLKKNLSLLDERINNESIWMRFRDFFPNPEMNQSYYINE